MDVKVTGGSWFQLLHLRNSVVWCGILWIKNEVDMICDLVSGLLGMPGFGKCVLILELSPSERSESIFFCMEVGGQVGRCCRAAIHGFLFTSMGRAAVLRMVAWV